MKEIKNKTIYTPDNVKKFLEVYYFEKVKVPRLIINILILLVIIYFFTKDNRVLLDYTTFISVSYTHLLTRVITKSTI